MWWWELNHTWSEAITVLRFTYAYVLSLPLSLSGSSGDQGKVS